MKKTSELSYVELTRVISKAILSTMEYRAAVAFGVPEDGQAQCLAGISTAAAEAALTYIKTEDEG